jgi:hypothetical protein
MSTRPTEAALLKLSRISFGWSISTAQSAYIQSAASRLHLMAIDLMVSSSIEEQDLVTTNTLFKTLCKKMDYASCVCSSNPLFHCPQLTHD